MFHISPGIVISFMGLVGLLLTFVDNTGFIGSKIPLTIFFLLIVVLGILYEAWPKEYLDDSYGQMQTKNQIG